jgi:hypothetical protein
MIAFAMLREVATMEIHDVLEDNTKEKVKPC